MRYLSRIAGVYKRQAAAAMEGKDFRAALDALNRYLTVDPPNKDMIASAWRR